MATIARSKPQGAGTRPAWMRALILVGLGIYALVFGEIFLRALAPEAIIPRYVTGGDDGVRANMPGVTFRQWTPEVDVRLTYNEAGMRDDRPAPPLARAPGECRIAILGDSYFVGFESSFADSFAVRLERALESRGRACRTLNFAVSGFGHAEQLRILDSRVLPWKPDVILMSVHGSDGNDNLRAALYRLDEEGRLVPRNAAYLPGVAISDRLHRVGAYLWAQENSHLYSALRNYAGKTGKQLLALLRRREAAATAAEDGADGPAFRGNPALNRAIVRQIETEARASGARLMLFEIPRMRGREEVVSTAPDLLGRDLLADIPFASAAGAFRAAAGPDVKLQLERGHHHWTPLGNRLAAEAAADALVRHGLLP